MTVAAANKSLWSKVSIAIVSTLIGICLGAQFNLLASLLHTNLEVVSGDSFLDGGIPHVDQNKNYEKHGEKMKLVDPTNSTTASYMEWHDKPPKIPTNWSYSAPEWCTPTKNCESCYQKWLQNAPYTSMNNTTEKIIVHYHIQHNAGTNFFALAHTFTPCATRACWQTSKHCLVSYNEEVEANNIRSNYYQHGVQYVSYENMLPPRFPMPFVSESAREGLFFTTILRDPMKRMITWLRQLNKLQQNDREKDVGSPPDFFWTEMEGVRGVYKRENVNVRWLSGALDDVTSDHVNIAKCRLQLFDLIIVDTLYDTAIEDVICPLNNWQGLDERKIFCNNAKVSELLVRKNKSDPLNGTDSHFIGAWIERLRPSFELYDYARILSYAHLKSFGVKNVPQISEVPSYIETLSKYTNVTYDVPEGSRVSLRNIHKMHPPKEFCDKMKLVWGSNADEVPYIYGIGTLAKL
jgi:hypothetical protein